MSRPPSKLTGEKFTRLTVLEMAAGRKNGSSRWLCRCDCGAELVVDGRDLKRGNTKSCGCYAMERWKNPETKSRTHGMSRSDEYAIWNGITRRCLCPQDERYHRYGGRGIKVCERWSDFANFYADMGPRPSPNHSIDRIKNDGNYEPSNCRWATHKEQSNNMSVNRWIEIAGTSRTLAQWSNVSGVNPATILGRIRRGWGVEEAVLAPVMKQNRNSKDFSGID